MKDKDLRKKLGFDQAYNDFAVYPHGYLYRLENKINRHFTKVEYESQIRLSNIEEDLKLIKEYLGIQRVDEPPRSYYDTIQNIKGQPERE